MDIFSKKKRSEVMSAVRHRNTKPEMLLRKQLSAAGLRYRVQYGKERIDVAFPSKKVAVFVDGCFWHMCPKHGEFPASNRGYWVPKLKRNARRDKEVNARLKKAGWTVVRVWEHSIRDECDACAYRILKTLTPKKNSASPARG